MRLILCLLFAGILAGCSTLTYVDIQTCNPAEITFPATVGKVLVVNHAVAQPADKGYVYLLGDEKQDTCRAYADSALMDACRSLGQQLVAGDYFNDVLFYHDPLRTDDRYWEDRKMDRRVVDSLCQATQVDALITFDRLLFDMEKQVNAHTEGYEGTIRVKIGGVARAYLSGRDQPLATVYVQDSIYWQEWAGNQKMLDMLLPTPDEALRTAGTYIGKQLSPNFVPHWDNETRWYFSTSEAKWKEAAAYAAAEKWEEAFERWKMIYERGNWKSQARTASNLALCEEMRGHLREAYTWAKKSYDLFKEHTGEEAVYTKLLEAYESVLAERVQKDQKLNVQFGEEITK